MPHKVHFCCKTFYYNYNLFFTILLIFTRNQRPIKCGEGMYNTDNFGWMVSKLVSRFTIFIYKDYIIFGTVHKEKQIRTGNETITEI